MACALLAKHNSGVLRLATRHPSGVPDNAYAYNNIKDMCDGKQASVSRYRREREVERENEKREERDRERQRNRRKERVREIKEESERGEGEREKRERRDAGRRRGLREQGGETCCGM